MGNSMEVALFLDSQKLKLEVPYDSAIYDILIHTWKH